MTPKHLSHLLRLLRLVHPPRLLHSNQLLLLRRLHQQHRLLRPFRLLQPLRLLAHAPRFVVKGKRGATVRREVEVTSEAVGEIPCGARVEIVEERQSSVGVSRVRIGSPLVGWLSRKCLVPA